MTGKQNLVDDIRAISRTMVRELGFMGGAFAGTDLSPSAVHALIEIEQGGVTARELGARLRLEKSSVSRMLRKLIDAQDVHEEAGEEDGRVKMLSLTASGRQRVAAIHAFARAQVEGAVGRLRPGEEETVVRGLGLYAEALAARAEECKLAPPIELVAGYRTGLIARILEMHAFFYARQSGFGQRFESVVASGLAEFCNRLDKPGNAIWTAMRDNDIIGSVAIDGEDMGDNIAHLRWFIVSDNTRGSGIGRKLLSSALSFVDEKGFRETQLWTFSGLSAARHLYESLGFVCAEERPGEQWGKQVMEQRFVRPLQ